MHFDFLLLSVVLIEFLLFRWNIVWCGSCPWTAGEYLAPGVPDPPSLKGLIRVGGVAVEVNDVVQDVTGAIVQIADAIDA